MVELSRRQFLKKLTKFSAAAVGLACVPTVSSDALEQHWHDHPKPVKLTVPRQPIADNFMIKGRDIRYTGKGDRFTVLELHRWLTELSNQLPTDYSIIDLYSLAPSIRYTNHIIELVNGFNIDDRTGKFLINGSLYQDNRETLYSQMGF